MDTIKKIKITTSGKMHAYDYAKHVYVIIDANTDNGYIAFCSTHESAREMCHEYCADIYDDVPENVENVWIDDYTLDTWFD